MTADINQLDPRVLTLYKRLTGNLEAKGYECHAIQTWRSAAQQNALSAAVTSVGADKSKHCMMDALGRPASHAFDLGFFDPSGRYIGDGGFAGYMLAGALWKQYALEPALAPLKLVWGGDWKVPHDPDHFQIA